MKLLERVLNKQDLRFLNFVISVSLNLIELFKGTCPFETIELEYYNNIISLLWPSIDNAFSF